MYVCATCVYMLYADEPSADQFANMNSALNWMLLQPADDDGLTGSSIAFGAWPCSWDADFKLAAPLNTTVEGVFKDGKLVSLTVTPPSRRSSVHVQPCQDV
jgi:alpha-L-fucosidase 2